MGRVAFTLRGAAPQGEALLHAARLGLTVENDVRVASERLKLMQVSVAPIRYVPLVPIRESAEREAAPLDPHIELEDMPLL